MLIFCRPGRRCSPRAARRGLYGSWLGARRLPPLAIRRLLAVVLVIAGLKLLLSA